MSDYVLTLIAASEQLLTQGLVLDVCRELRVKGSDVLWQEDRQACDIFFTLSTGEELQSVNPFYLLRRGIRHIMEPQKEMFEWRQHELLKSAANILKGLPIDAIVQPTQGRRKKLLLSDMDSTMITIECIDELADFVGKKAEVAAITEQAMNGELNFESALGARVALLEGLPEATLQECYDSRVRFMPGAYELVQTMRKKGAACVLVSGGFTFFTERVAEALGFQEHYANELEIKDGVLTGKVVLPILGKEAKVARLNELRRRLNLNAEEILAVGDGANDLPMLLEAGLGVAYHAKPAVQAEATSCVNYHDLSALLTCQGIPQREWVRRQQAA